MFSPIDLPNDINALKALLLASERLVRERDATIATQGNALLNMQAQLTTRAAEIEHLKLQIAKLRRMQFGRKSEKLDHQIEQLELQLEDLQADDAEAEREMPAANSAPRKRAPRKPLPDHLPRDVKLHLPAAGACPACGGGLRPLGEDVAEQLEFTPASFRVVRHVLRLPRHHRAGASAEPADRTRHRRSGPAGPCTSGQVRRPPATVSPARCCVRWST